MTALRSESSGIRYQTHCVYTGIAGIPGPLGGEGFLGFWHKESYKKLESTTDSKYTLRNYVDELDVNIEAVARLLRHGLALSIFVANGELLFLILRLRGMLTCIFGTDAVDATQIRDECANRIKYFQTTLFDTYPHGLRELLPQGYGTNANQNGVWYRFDKQNTNDHLYVSRDIIIEVIVGGGNRSDKEAGFQFFHNSEPLGLLQMCCAVDNRGNRRVHYYDRV